jgi:hypothetical protein
MVEEVEKLKSAKRDGVEGLAVEEGATSGFVTTTAHFSIWERKQGELRTQMRQEEEI